MGDLNVSVLVPYRAGELNRDRAWQWVRAWWADRYPTFEVVTGVSPPGPFNRAAATHDALGRAGGDLVIVADADLWCEGIDAAIDAVGNGAAWAVPHSDVHRLDEPTTANVLEHGEPALCCRTARLAERPYLGHPCGGLVVMPAATARDVGPDPRFVGWGREDDAWKLALRTLVGREWRGRCPLFHLWHPPQERPGRRRANPASERLYRRYQHAKNKPDAMRALLAEVAECSSSSSPAPPP